MSRADNEISAWLSNAREIEIHKAGNAQGLIDWYNAGADGQINWGSPGDFEACVAIAGKHIDNPEGFCQLRHIDATGEPAGKAEGEVKKTEEEPDYTGLFSGRKGEPTDKDLYEKVKTEAKAKFDVYPSAVANGWVVQEYKRRGGKYQKTATLEKSALDQNEEVKKGGILNSVIAGVVASHHVQMSSALVGGIAGVATALALANKKLNGSTDPNTIASVAQNAVNNSITIDSGPMAEALTSLYLESGNAGVLAGAGQVGFSNPDAQKALDGLMKNQAQILKGLDKTTLSLIATSIQQGIISGADIGDVTSQINALVNNPARLNMILLTESVRAYNAGILGVYDQAGISQFNWICTETACEQCEAEEGVHDMGDDVQPPLHPNCQCEITPVVENQMTKNYDPLGTFSAPAKHSADSAQESAMKGDQLRQLGKWESATIAHQFAASKFRDAANHERSSNHPHSADNARILEEKAGEQDQQAKTAYMMSVAPTHSPAESQITKYENPPFKQGAQDWGYLDTAEHVLLPDTQANFENEDESSSSTDHIQPISVAYIQGALGEANEDK